MGPDSSYFSQSGKDSERKTLEKNWKKAEFKVALFF